MKRITTLLLAILFLSLLALPLSAAQSDSQNSSFISDGADLLSDGEKAVLETKIKPFCAKYRMELFIFIPSPLQEGTPAQELGEQFWNTHATLSDGAVIVLCLQSRKWDIQGFGALEAIYTKDALDLLEDSCIPHFSDGNYYQGFAAFVDGTERVVKADAAGTPYKSPFPWFGYLLISLFVGFTIGLITVLVFKAQLKSVARQSSARDYLKQDSLRITEQRDLFLYRNLTRTPRPKSNSSSGTRGTRSGGRGGSF